MGTTVWVDDEVRQELRRLQDSLHASSVNETIKVLIGQPSPDARSLFRRHQDAIGSIMKAHHLHGLVAFGSRARGDHRIDSDLDLAVNLGEGATAMDFLSAERELEELLGITIRMVDLPRPLLHDVIEREGVPFD